MWYKCYVIRYMFVRNVRKTVLVSVFLVHGMLKLWTSTFPINAYIPQQTNHHDQQLVRLVVKVFPPNSKSEEQKR